MQLIVYTAIVDNIFRPPCPTHNEYFRPLSFIKIWLESRLLCLSRSMAAKHLTRHRAHCAKTYLTSSTKPEVLNISQRRQRRTEPRPKATRKKLVKFGLVFFEICDASHLLIKDEQTNNRRIYLSQYFAPFLRGGQSNNRPNQCLKRLRHKTIELI